MPRKKKIITSRNLTCNVCRIIMGHTTPTPPYLQTYWKQSLTHGIISFFKPRLTCHVKGDRIHLGQKVAGTDVVINMPPNQKKSIKWESGLEAFGDTVYVLRHHSPTTPHDPLSGAKGIPAVK